MTPDILTLLDPEWDDIFIQELEVKDILKDIITREDT